MMAIGDHNHAAAFHGADVGADTFRCAFRIAAVPMDMGALGDGLITARVTRMGAGASRHAGSIAALRGVLGVVRAQPVAFRGVGRNRDVTQHQNPGQQTAKHPLQHLLLHFTASDFQMVFGRWGLSGKRGLPLPARFLSEAHRPKGHTFHVTIIAHFSSLSMVIRKSPAVHAAFHTNEKDPGRHKCLPESFFVFFCYPSASSCQVRSLMM